MPYQTAQENFWAGEFGNDYIARNAGEAMLASNLAFFSKALRLARKPKDCIEFGANIGMNLAALKLLYPGQSQSAIEINPQAAEELARVIPRENIHVGSILEFNPEQTWDLAFVMCVLIHIAPELLGKAYDALHAATGRYLLIAEYYNPRPVAIAYRGHQEKLFKRDFCGEMLDRHPDLKLIDYGFAYHRDPNFPQDDVSWFLMEKGQ